MKRIPKKVFAVLLCIVLCSTMFFGNINTFANTTLTATGSVDLLTEGQVPIIFAAATGLGNVQSYNFNTTLRYWGVSGQYTKGYSPADEETKSEWLNREGQEHQLQYLTDNNTNTYMGIQPEYSGYWTVVAYKLDEATIDSISILSQEKNDYTERIVVYVSDSYDTLLTSESIVYGADADLKTWATEIDIESINKKGSYVAIATKQRGFSIIEIEVLGTPEQEEVQAVDLLDEGQNPIIFAAATGLGNVQAYTFNTTLRYWGVSGEYKYGYTPTDEETKSAWLEREGQEHQLLHLTDNDPTTKMGIQPLYSGYWSVVAYKLDEATINSISILSEAKSDYSQRIVVYVSDSYDTLLTTESIVYGGDGAEKTWATEINIDSINKKGSYVAIATKERGFSILEIEVLGTPEQEEQQAVDLLDEGQNPIIFAASSGLGNVQAYTFNTTLRYWGVSGAYKYGYSPSNEETKSEWLNREGQEHQLLHLTDNDPNTKMGLQPEYSGPWTVVAYEFDKATINAISILSEAKSDYSQRIVVYVSDSYDTLLTTESIVYGGDGAEKTWATEINIDSINKEGSYVAIATKERGFSILEIEVLGVPEPVQQSSLTDDKTPVALYPVYDGTTKYAFAYVKVGSSETNYRFGLSKGEAAPEGSVSELLKLTDADSSTATRLKNESCVNESGVAGDAQDIAIVYKLDDLAKISNVVVNGEGASGVEIYLANSYASLFNNANLINQYDTTSADMTLYAPKQASYVGIIVRISGSYRTVKIGDIAVYGEYVEKSAGYGENLTTSTTNENANEATKMFYEYLNYVGKSENVLLGAHINAEADTLTQASNEDNYYDYLSRKSGLTPSIYSTRINTQSIESYVQCYEQGSVPIIMCLFASKLQTFNDYNTSQNDDYASDFMIKYLDKTYTPTILDNKTLAQNAYNEFWASVEEAGEFFKSLEEAGVETYIVSPFNEMNMYGFYGDKSHTSCIQNFKNVWQQVHYYLVDDPNGPQLTGALFALRPTGTHADGSYRVSPYSYYPGDDYVDIIAPTVYSETDDGVLQTFTGYDDFVATGKPIGLSETGLLSDSANTSTADCLNLLESFKTTYKDLSFASLWYGYRFDIYKHQNTTEFLNDDYILTVESMHDYRHLNIPEFVGNSPDDVMKVKESLINSNIKAINFDENGVYSLYAPADITDTRMIELDVYVIDDATDSLTVKLIDNSGNYITYDFTDIVEGWNHLAIRLSDTADTSEEFDYSNVSGYELISTQNSSIYVSNLYAAQYLDGDANRDGIFDVRDLVRTSELLSGVTTKGNKLAVSEDYVIDNLDLAAVRRALL